MTNLCAPSVCIEIFAYLQRVIVCTMRVQPAHSAALWHCIVLVVIIKGHKKGIDLRDYDNVSDYCTHFWLVFKQKRELQA